MLGRVPAFAHIRGDARETQQCDLSKAHGGPIACEKAAIRQMLAKQFRVALSLNGKMKGVVLLSQIAAIVQKVVADTWDGSKVEAINEAVGFFINEEGYMDWDVTRIMDTTSIAACAAVGPSAALPADVGSALTGWRAARAAQRQRTEDEICKKEREWAAACDALKNADVAPVGMPTHAVPRSRPRSKNEHGCCISSSDHIAELEAIEAEKKLVAMSSQQRVDEFWVNWRAPVREAEKALREPQSSTSGAWSSRVQATWPRRQTTSRPRC